ncbi:MAG: M23 family metallopeptidase [Firmicutes bacterium]|nr:M23 family metallopeptidase [Bacillota bacterium]
MRYPFDKFGLGTRYGEQGESWKCGWHSGLDMVSVAAGGDGLVYPLYAGVVYKVGHSGSYGNCVYVRHADGYMTLYAHLRDVYVKVGMEVNEKTVLGAEGATGNASGRHLHIEVHRGNYSYPASIDPLEFIKERLEITKKIKIRLNGIEKTVTAIEKDGNNYVKLQDLRDDKISVGYDATRKLPVVEVIEQR